jgi:23S rRNA (adenine2503-C2)-methyltransferase
MRKMTISTCGVVPGIQYLTEIKSQIGLAVSLHSSFDDRRNVLVPMNKKYPLAVLMDACREYGSVTGRRITFEMALTQETCTPEEASALAKLLRGMTAHVNLIPINLIPDSGFTEPDWKAINCFKEALDQVGIPVSVRKSKGSDIEAACGQLRSGFDNRRSESDNRRSESDSRGSVCSPECSNSEHRTANHRFGGEACGPIIKM